MYKIAVVTRHDITDIDALACAVAYTEVLNFEGKEAVAVVPGVFNNSVTNEIKKWDIPIKKRIPRNIQSFVIVDSSDPNSFPKNLPLEKVTEIFDHHAGYEKYWKQKLGDKSKIEPIGACATLILEEIAKRNTEISELSTNLLYAAIVSNTLSFKARVTTDRDVKAFMQLFTKTSLNTKWIKKYFVDQQKEAEKNPQKTLQGDTKIINFKNLNKNIAIGQIELWNGNNFINKNANIIEKTLSSYKSDEWFLTIPSIFEEKNYIFCKSSHIMQTLENCMGIKFCNNLAETHRLWERKEITRSIRKKS